MGMLDAEFEWNDQDDDEYTGYQGSWLGDDSDDDWDFGGDLLDMGKELGGAVWDWGVKNPGTALSAIGSGIKGVMDYYEDDPKSSTSEQIDYYKERNAKHDQGMRDYVASKKKE